MATTKTQTRTPDEILAERLALAWEHTNQGLSPRTALARDAELADELAAAEAAAALGGLAQAGLDSEDKEWLEAAAATRAAEAAVACNRARAAIGHARALRAAFAARPSRDLDAAAAAEFDYSSSVGSIRGREVLMGSAPGSRAPCALDASPHSRRRTNSHNDLGWRNHAISASGTPFSLGKSRPFVKTACFTRSACFTR